MGDKVIVLTVYGKDKSIENISVSLFDSPHNYSYGMYYTGMVDSITNYCENINALELKDDKWIYARAIRENEKITLEIPPRFDVINQLHDLHLQVLLREVSHYDVALVLKDIDEETKERFFRNMSKRTAFMIQEDSNAMQNMSDKDVSSAKKRILEKIFKLMSDHKIFLDLD